MDQKISSASREAHSCFLTGCVDANAFTIARRRVFQYVIRRSEVCLHTCRSHHVTHDLPMHD